jgi:hypothetical protein
MKYGVVLPFGDARTAADFAYEAEQAGWDGFFVWEPVWGVDAWVALTAAAMRTERIKLGTMLSPVSRMRPWKLASETATLDNLSGGRVILSVGLGAVDTGFEEFGEATDRKTRAGLMDEGLDVLNGLWSGQPFEYKGKYYWIKPTEFQPPDPPIQQPRIPIWVVGAWRRMKSMRRVLNYDGLLPHVMTSQGEFQDVTPNAIREMKAFIDEYRTLDTPFDIVMEGETPGDDPEESSAIIRVWQNAGVTWWIEALWNAPRDESGQKQVLERIVAGPPSIS